MNMQKSISTTSTLAMAVVGFIIGEPPEYDSVTWHYKMQRFGNLYALLEDDIIVGGAILFRKKRNYKYYMLEEYL